MSSDPSRRDILKTMAASVAPATALAGCNTPDDSEKNSNGTEDERTPTTQDPTYDLRVSALEYDLTDLATSETNTHDQAYVQDNYSAELGVTVLNNGEEVGLEELGEVHLENEEGETVETTEEGYVPEYAVEDGQELTVRAEVDGETMEETITVNKELPSEFYADARIQEGGETLYDTDWNTPYSFDNHIVDRQASLNQRAERRDELADDELILESDLETWRDHFEEDEDELTEEEKKEYYLGAMSGLMEGASIYEGTGAENNAFNLEKAMLEHSPYEEIFIGGFTNPKEPDVPSAGDGDGYRVESQVAYVDGDWYHVGKDNAGAKHISEIDEIRLVGDQGGNYGAVSVLAEFERGNTELLSYDNSDSIVQETVTSPVTLNGNMTELELSDDISWNTLNQIRDNTQWEEAMVPMELATAIGTKVERSISIEGENPENPKIKIG